MFLCMDKLYISCKCSWTEGFYIKERVLTQRLHIDPFRVCVHASCASRFGSEQRVLEQREKGRIVQETVVDPC